MINSLKIPTKIPAAGMSASGVIVLQNSLGLDCRAWFLSFGGWLVALQTGSGVAGPS